LLALPYHQILKKYEVPQWVKLLKPPKSAYK
jgi:hypothetical protein